MAEFASKGVAGAGLGTGIAGLALGVLNGGLGNILGNGNGGYGHPVCSENTPVNRFELSQEQKIATLESQIALRDAQVYTDSKLIDLTRYLETKITAVSSDVNAVEKHIYRTEKDQAVFNEKVTGKFGELSTVVACQGRTLDSITFSAVNENKICSPGCCNY